MTPPPPAGVGIAAAVRRSWRRTVVVAGLLVGACSPVQVVNALVPSSNYTLLADQSYGPLARQKLDVYMPVNTGRPAPIVVFFYGGNWQTGARADYLFVGEALASRGFIAVIPDYRLYPEVRYPDFLRDAAGAVSWTLRHSEAIGGDPTAGVHLMGHSAGGYIAAMLALDPRWLGTDRALITSTVGLAGPYDFLPLTDPVLQVIFGTSPDLTQTQPITFADGSAAPMLLISGLSDTTVLPANSQRLAARIRERGGTAEEIYYKGGGHIGLVGSLAAPLRFLASTLEDSAAFLRRCPASR